NDEVKPAAILLDVTPITCPVVTDTVEGAHHVALVPLGDVRQHTASIEGIGDTVYGLVVIRTSRRHVFAGHSARQPAVPTPRHSHAVHETPLSSRWRDNPMDRILLVCGQESNTPRVTDRPSTDCQREVDKYKHATDIRRSIGAAWLDNL